MLIELLISLRLLQLADQLVYLPLASSSLDILRVAGWLVLLVQVVLLQQVLLIPLEPFLLLLVAGHEISRVELLSTSSTASAIIVLIYLLDRTQCVLLIRILILILLTFLILFLSFLLLLFVTFCFALFGSLLLFL